MKWVLVVNSHFLKKKSQYVHCQNAQQMWNRGLQIKLHTDSPVIFPYISGAVHNKDPSDFITRAYPNSAVIFLKDRWFMEIRQWHNQFHSETLNIDCETMVWTSLAVHKINHVWDTTTAILLTFFIFITCCSPTWKDLHFLTHFVVNGHMFSIRWYTMQ